MGWIRYIRCKKLQRDFVGRNFVLIAPVQYVLHQLTCKYETIPNAPKYYKRTETLVQGQMGWIGCIRFKKYRRDIVARTFALIVPDHPVLHQVSCSYETIPNAPKYYETHRNISLGSKCTQILQNAPKHQFWVQWGGLGAFVAKNPDVTLWHELLH